MSESDAREQAREHDPFCNLMDNYLAYVRILDFENGYNIMMTLMQDKKTKLFHGVIRMRRPDGVKPFSAKHKSKSPVRAKALAEFIGVTTSFVAGMRQFPDGSEGFLIDSDKAYEFTYGDDDDEMMRQMKDSDMFDIRTEPVKGSKDNPQG